MDPYNNMAPINNAFHNNNNNIVFGNRFVDEVREPRTLVCRIHINVYANSKNLERRPTTKIAANTRATCKNDEHRLLHENWF